MKNVTLFNDLVEAKSYRITLRARHVEEFQKSKIKKCYKKYL